MRENLSYVVVDIAAQHALELTREEFEPLLSASARRDSQGPYAGAGKISSSLIRAVRPTPPPGSLTAPEAEIPPPASTPGFTVSTGFNPSASAATFGGGTSVTLSPLSGAPPDELLDALADVLRGYPEVEWACLVQASRGPSAPVPAVGLRVDAGFRQRVNEIIQGCGARPTRRAPASTCSCSTTPRSCGPRAGRGSSSIPGASERAAGGGDARRASVPRLLDTALWTRSDSCRPPSARPSRGRPARAGWRRSRGASARR
ncbi:MAG: hypothetical protein M5U28_34605 [Sandaracinaceae bacterium]|nr:hypothetical protein [Sandaracinaceae bacterium]